MFLLIPRSLLRGVFILNFYYIRVLINQIMLISKDAVNRGLLPKLGCVRRVEIAELGDAGVSAAIIGVLGNEPLIGRNLARRFRITLDHGQQVILEP